MVWKGFVVGVLAIALSACGGSSLNGEPDIGTETEMEASAPPEDVTTGNGMLEDSTESGDGSASSIAGSPVEIGMFTADELFAAGGGGCGMSLWWTDADPWEDGILFFHGLGDAVALMRLDGTMMPLSRTAASGEEFYGQQTFQRFATEDGSITVEVEATLGEPGEIESVGIPEAVLTIDAQGQTESIAVVGDAGC